MRNFFLAIILLLGIIFFIGRFTEVQAIVETLERGDWRFLLLALSVQCLWLLTMGLTYREIYRAIGLKEKAQHLIVMASAANFINIVAPSAGMSGMAVFVSEAKRRHYSPGKVVAAGTISVLLDYAAFLIVLALGLVVLFRRNNLNTGQLIAAGFLLMISIMLATLIYLGVRSEEALGRALSWMAGRLNRLLRPFTHREYLSENRAREFAHDVTGALKELSREPKKALPPIALALVKQALLIMVLFLTFLAFDVPVSVGTLIAGFSIGYLFMIISPTPAGLGVVEGMLTLALTSMYIPFGAAAVITLAYRGFTFWIPLLVGMMAVRWLGGSKDVQVMI